MQDALTVRRIPDLILAERGGRRRTLTLFWEALPTQRATFALKTRYEAAAYQGTAEKTINLFGLDQMPVTFRGHWRDRWLGSRECATLTEGRSARWLRTAAEVIAAVKSLWEASEDLDLVWGPERMRVVIDTFAPTYIRPEDVEWELTLEPIGPGGIDAKASYASEFDFRSDTGGLLASLSRGLTSVRQSLQGVQQLSKRLTAYLDRVDSLRKQLDSTLATATQVALLPVTLSSRVAQTAKDLTQTWAQLRRSVESYDAATDEANASMADVARAYGASSSVHAESRKQGAEASRLSRKAARIAEPRVIKVIKTTTETDLRRVAADVYGSMDRWEDIARFNGLTVPLVPPGRTLLVPEVTL